MPLEQTGLVIPLYFHESTDAELRRELMAAATDGLSRYVPPERWVLVRDGAPWMADDVSWLCERIESRTGGKPLRLESDDNTGKGGAVVRGLAHALKALPDAALFSILDGDGDHSPHDLPELVELQHTVQNHTDTDLVSVVGRRMDRHGCLGFLRGEMEGITNRVAFSSLRYALARQGRALDETWVAPFGEPDMEAGYRLYSRSAAELVVQAYPRAVEDWGDQDLLRWGVEIVPTFELVLAGGIHAEGLRTTQETQPTSAYLAGVDATHAYALELGWMFRRAQVPPEAALLMLQDALLKSTLRHQAEGLECLLSLEDRVREGLGIRRAPENPGLAKPRRRL